MNLKKVFFVAGVLGAIFLCIDKKGRKDYLDIEISRRTQHINGYSALLSVYGGH